MTKEEKRKVGDLMVTWSASIVVGAFIIFRIATWIMLVIDDKFDIDIFEAIENFYWNKFSICGADSTNFAYWTLVIVAAVISCIWHYMYAVCCAVEDEDTSKMAE